jgi:protein TonB
MHAQLPSLFVLTIILLCRASAAHAADAQSTSAPILIQTSCTAAQETWRAMKSDEEGDVTLRFVVRSDGAVESAEIQSESTGIRLARIARRHYLKCQFRPATRDGQLVQGQTTISLSFGRDNVLAGPGKSRCEVPSYPTESLRRGAAGTTSMEVTFTDDGHVKHVALLASSGTVELDEAALKAMRTCRRTPFQAPLDEHRFTFSFRWAP